MYTLNKFLGSFSLRKGAIFICTLDLFVSGALVFCYKYNEAINHLGMRVYDGFFELWALMIRLIISSIVLYGVLAKKPYLIMVKIIFEFWALVFLVAHMVAQVIPARSSKDVNVIVLTSFFLVINLLFYFWLVVLSYYYELKRGNHPSNGKALTMKAATAHRMHMEPYRKMAEKKASQA